MLGQLHALARPIVAVNWGDMISEQAFGLGRSILIAVIIFIVGLIVARMAAALVRRALNKTDWDDKLAAKFGYDPAKQQGKLEGWVGTGVFVFIMGLVLIAVLDSLELGRAAAPIQGLLATVIAALPAVGKAILILLVAWLIATVVRKLVTATLDKLGIDKRIADLEEAEAPAKDVSLSSGVGTVLYWLILFFGLTGALDALNMTSVVAPLGEVLRDLLAALPAVAHAAVILFIGYICGKIARTVITNLLASAGLDKLTARLKLEKVFAKRPASAVLGLVVMAFIVLQALIAALDKLGLETLSGPLTNMMGSFWSILPNVVVASVIVGLAVIIGRIVRVVVADLLEGIGFDRLANVLGIQAVLAKSEKLKKPSALIGQLVLLTLVLVALSQALDTLGLGAWSRYLEAMLAYAVQNVLPAVIIVGLGLWLGNYARELLASKEDASRNWLAALARVAILIFASTMALHQLDVAQDFITLAFGLLLGALCLALGLAFGLGGRDVAGQIVKKAYEKSNHKSNKK